MTVSTDKKIINLPFYCGHYESLISYCISDNVEREREYLTEEFGIDFTDWENESVLYDYTVDYNAIGKSYTDYVAAELELESLEFESISSPKEYNFATDRLFAYISDDDIQKLYNAARNNIALFEEVVKERFTSYDGFISFYSNNIDDWLEKLLEEFDHNELATLLVTYAAVKLGKDKLMDINYSWYEDNGYEIIANSIEFSKELYDLRDKAAEETEE